MSLRSAQIHIARLLIAEMECIPLLSRLIKTDLAELGARTYMIGLTTDFLVVFQTDADGITSIYL